MSFADLQDDYGDLYVPRFSVTVSEGGTTETFDGSRGVVSDLSVETSLDRAASFSFTLNYPFSFEDGGFTGLDWELFTAGADVEIEIGYGDDREQLAVGSIVSVSPDYPKGGGPTVAVEGYGLLHNLSNGTHSETWTDATLADVVSGVVNRDSSRYGFAEPLTIPEDGPTFEEIKQDEGHRSDLQFLLVLAREYGFELFSRGDEFVFRPPGYDQEPAVSLRYGESLGSFSPQINAADQVGSVEVRHYDQRNKETITASAEADGVGEGTEVKSVPVRTQEEAKARAEGALEQKVKDVMRGRGESVGIPTIRAGTTVNLTGLGGGFDNVYYVDSATHRIGSDGYTTSFTVRRRST